MKKPQSKKSILLQSYLSLLFFDILEYAVTRVIKIKPTFKELRNSSKIVQGHLKGVLNRYND